MFAVVVVVLVFLVVMVVPRVARKRRRGAALTVELTVDGSSVRRVLADGRREEANWADVSSVEVVCTPVTTVDGAKAFTLIAESDEAGCLVPLGVGYDDALVPELSRLPGFRLERFVEATGHRPPHRTIVWTRADA